MLPNISRWTTSAYLVSLQALVGEHSMDSLPLVGMCSILLGNFNYIAVEIESSLGFVIVQGTL